MEEQRSIPSNNALHLFLAVATLTFLKPGFSVIPIELLHPRLRAYLENPSYVFIVSYTLIGTIGKNSSVNMFMLGLFCLACFNSGLAFQNQAFYVFQYSLCYGFIALGLYVKLPSQLMLSCFCLDGLLSFYTKVFFSHSWHALTPLSLNDSDSILTQLSIVILPSLALIYNYFFKRYQAVKAP